MQQDLAAAAVAAVAEETQNKDLPEASSNERSGDSDRPQQPEHRSSRGFFHFGSKNKEVPGLTVILW